MTVAARRTQVQNAFRTFDEDKSGSVSASEFRLALAALGFDMTDAEFAKLIDKYDANGDGTCSTRTCAEVPRQSGGGRGPPHPMYAPDSGADSCACMRVWRVGGRGVQVW